MFCVLVFIILFASDGFSEENNNDPYNRFTWSKERKQSCLSSADIDHIFDNNLIPDPKAKIFESFRIKLMCRDEYLGISSECLLCDEDDLDNPGYHASFICDSDCRRSPAPLLQPAQDKSCGKKILCLKFRIPELPEHYLQPVSPATTYVQENIKPESYEDCGLQDPYVKSLLQNLHPKNADVPPPPPLRRRRRHTYTTTSDDGSEISVTVHEEFSPAGARVSAIAEVQWHAGIYTKKTRPYMQICGGTIVSHNVVISAAHCFWSDEDQLLPAIDYAVAAGKLYRSWNDPQDADYAQKSDIADIKIPPYFKGHTTNLQEDIAVVIIKKPFTFRSGVRPACLDFNEEVDQKYLEPHTLGTVAGWGLTSEDGPASPVLQIVELPVLDVQECFQQADPTFRGHITSDKFCAGWNNGTAVCKGDSGGGFFVQSMVEGEPRFYLRGVVSGAPQNEHLCNVYSWASFTRVQKHERFIKEAMRNSVAGKS